MKEGEIIYRELSYKLVGVLYDVYNELGPGYKEIIYQKALAKAFYQHGIKFKEQVHCEIFFKKDKVGCHYLDFVIEGKIILEIKRKARFSRNDFEQVNNYLKTTGLELGILASFSENGLKFFRVLNQK